MLLYFPHIICKFAKGYQISLKLDLFVTESMHTK